MFVVSLNKSNFEYDVHSLVKAFWPEEQVSVLTPESKEEKRAELAEQVRLGIELTDESAEITVEDKVYSWSYAEELASKSMARNENISENMGNEEAAVQDETILLKGNFKDGFKRFLYRSLSEVTGKTLPWGNLTGIRPTKIAYGLLDEGRTAEEIVEFLQQKHYVSEEKAFLPRGRGSF